MNKLLTFSLLFTATFATLPANAEDDVKRARANDIVDEYILEDSSKLVRRIGKLKCDVTTKVVDFKISMHPKDDAMMYFIKEGDLYELHNTGAATPGQCPKAEVVLAMKNVAKIDGKYKYNVVSSTNTKIVNMALDKEGNLKAWDNEKLVLTQNGVADYKMNICNDQPGAAFSRYVAFAEDAYGRILKVDGDKPEESKFSPESYLYSGNAIKDFKDREGVCKVQKASYEPATAENNTTAL